MYNDTDNAGLTLDKAAVDGKINNWKRMQQEWTKRLMNDSSFTDNSKQPSRLCSSGIARSDYQNRKARDDANSIDKNMPYIGQSPSTGQFIELDALTASATDTYTLQLNSANFAPESVNNLIVSINGVVQKSLNEP